MLPLPGYYPGSLDARLACLRRAQSRSSAIALNSYGTKFISCPRYASCLGSSATNASAADPFTTCADGYTGSLCGACISGYGRVGEWGCTVCPEEGENNAKMFFAVIGIICAFGFFTW